LTFGETITLEGEEYRSLSRQDIKEALIREEVIAAESKNTPSDEREAKAVKKKEDARIRGALKRWLDTLSQSGAVAVDDKLVRASTSQLEAFLQVEDG
jgi:hypothetical protein